MTADAPLGSTQTLLIVDDDRSNLQSLERIYQREGVHVLTAPDARAALDLLRTERIDVCLTDLMMPGTSGLELMRASKTVSPETQFIRMTAFGTVEKAVEAMKEGAWDFVTKPFKRIQIVRSVRRALDQQSLVAENRALRAQLDSTRTGRDIIGKQPSHAPDAGDGVPGGAVVGHGAAAGRERNGQGAGRAGRPPVQLAGLQAVHRRELRGAARDHPGGRALRPRKRRLHRRHPASPGSLRASRPGDAVFGRDRRDDVPTQVKLLRVLQESEFERVGGTQTLRVDVRIVAATNKDLAAEVEAGNFREDLFYRLNVISLSLPPLRERRDDIPLLAHHFLSRYADKNNKTLAGISKEAMEAMLSWQWPGNVRELENAMERAVVLCRSDTVGVDDLPPQVRGSSNGDSKFLTNPHRHQARRHRATVIRETLAMTRGDKKLAAQLLGIATRTIYRKI